MTETIKQTLRFGCRPEDLFGALMDERIVSTFTHSDAKIDGKVGGSFAFFGGSIHGTFVELVPNSRIVQNWRFSDWEENQFSRVEISLDSPRYGETRLTLVQTKVPLADRFGNQHIPERVAAGWKDNWWNRISKICGFEIIND